MRLLFAVTIFLLALAVGFFAGRMFAPVPVYAPGQVAGDGDLEQAWADFLRAQQETLDLYRGSPFFGDEQERAEAYRGVLYALAGSLETNALARADRPRFVRVADLGSKSGLDNPDNNYYQARLRDDAAYRVSGNRGTTADMVIQLFAGQPGVGGTGGGRSLGVLQAADITTDADGNFELIVSPQDPGQGANWLPSGEGAQTLLVRYTHSDWQRERAGELRIEPVAAEAGAPLPLTPALMAGGLRDAAISLYDRSATWLQYAERIWHLAPRNGISAVRSTREGLPGQYSAFGSWELGNDQALILSTARSDAAYQGIQLGNLWFVSLDYENRTSSLNLDQMDCGSDGRCYAVISHRDPGIRNWLDTGGHRRGLIMMRWQGLTGELPESQQPRARLIEFERLAEELPAELRSFDAGQRARQIRQRRAAVQARFNG